MSAAWFLCAGSIAAAASLMLAAVPGWLAGILVALVALTASWARSVLIGALAVGLALGALLAGLRIGALDSSLLGLLAERGDPVRLTGEVVMPPRPRDEETRLVIAIREVDGAIGRFRVRERIVADVVGLTTVAFADRVSLEGVALRPAIREPGWGARRWRASSRIAARASLRPDQISVLGPSRHPLRRVAAIARRAANRVADRLPAPSDGLLLGITIGDVSRLEPGTLEDMRITGLTHLVAVSGSNIALVLAGVAAMLRASRAPPTASGLVLLLVIALMAVITAFEPSVIRASIMAALVIAGVMLGARTTGVHLLGVTAVVAALSDPFLPLQLGFQLSMAATLGLLTVSRRLAEGWEDRPVLLAVAAAVGAQAATMPLLAFTTGEASLVAVPANLMVAALVAPATIIGFVAITAGAIMPVAGMIAWLTVPLLQVVSHLARTLASMPAAVVAIPEGPLGLLVVLGAALAVLVAAAPRIRVARATVIVLALAVPAAGGVFAACAKAAPLVGLTVTMLDVGQGDAILVTLDDRAMLIDGGDDGRGLARMLRRRGVDRLDLMVVSHAHDDHVSGLAEIVDRIPIGAILDPGLDADLRDYRRVVAVGRQREIPYRVARAGQRYPFGEATIEVLWPRDPLLEGTDSDLNENSIVMRIDYGSDCVLLAGETQELAQAELLRRDPMKLRCEVLKVSHHGSGRMDPAFYAATDAEVALIPVGRNGYGHPAARTLIALQGMRVLRSDDHGLVEVAVDGRGGLDWRTER